MPSESITGSITFTVIAISPNPQLIPTGVVVFASEATTLGVVDLNDGVATLTIPATTLGVGTFEIVAYYQGDENFASGTSLPLQEVITD